MTYLDANIILYAIEHEPKYGNACATILADIYHGTIKVGASTLVLLEVFGALRKLNNIRRNKGKPIIEIKEQMTSLLVLPIAWFDMTVFEIERARDLEFSLQTNDLLHVATAQLHDMHEIISADKDFDNVPGLKRIDPLDY